MTESFESTGGYEDSYQKRERLMEELLEVRDQIDHRFSLLAEGREDLKIELALFDQGTIEIEEINEKHKMLREDLYHCRLLISTQEAMVPDESEEGIKEYCSKLEELLLKELHLKKTIDQYEEQSDKRIAELDAEEKEQWAKMLGKLGDYTGDTAILEQLLEREAEISRQLEELE